MYVGKVRMFLGLFVVGCVGALCLGLKLTPLLFLRVVYTSWLVLDLLPLALGGGVV